MSNKKVHIPVKMHLSGCSRCTVTDKPAQYQRRELISDTTLLLVSGIIDLQKICSFDSSFLSLISSLVDDNIIPFMSHHFMTNVKIENDDALGMMITFVTMEINSLD